VGKDGQTPLVVKGEKKKKPGAGGEPRKQFMTYCRRNLQGKMAGGEGNRNRMK